MSVFVYSMAKFRTYQVGEEEEVEEHSLTQKHHPAEGWPWLLHLQERQQMHALILRLLQQCMNPAVVALHTTKTSEVTKEARYTTGYASDRLEEDEACQRLVGSWNAPLPAAQQIEVESYGSDRPVRQTVQSRLGQSMHWMDGADLLGLPQRVWQRVGVLNL